METINGYKCEIKHMKELDTVGFFVNGVFQCALSQDTTRHWMLTFDKFFKDISQILNIEEQEVGKPGYQFIPLGWAIASFLIAGHGIMNHKIKPRWSYKIEELFKSEDLILKVKDVFKNNQKINVISSEHQVKTLDLGGK